jgi:cell wall-associated NlpC family hydrolase
MADRPFMLSSRFPALLLLALAAATGACATGTGTPRPRPFPTPGGPTVALGQEIVATAMSLRGAPYRDGGDDPSGFDCSGFVRYVLGRHGVAVPRDVSAQFRAGLPVDPFPIRSGDLLFFSTVAPGASHVGIAIDGDRFVHAPSSRGSVRVDRLGTRYWKERYLGARRPQVP